MFLIRSFYLILTTLLISISYLSAQTVEKVTIGNIIITGNRVTHQSIILRELEFRQGDTIPKDQINILLNKARKNLLNLPLFHFATINAEPNVEQGTIDIAINLTERWYTWLWPVFELSDRNFNTWLSNGDLTRLSYGLFLQQENFRGRLEKLHVKIKFGYQQEAMLLYEKPYLNRRKTIGAGIQISLSRQRETGYITNRDKLVFYRAEDFLLHTADLATFIRYRPDIHFSHTLQIRYNILRASDSLLLLNNEYTPGGSQKPEFLELSYLLKADFRDQRAYPLKGWYAEASVAKSGILSSDACNFVSAKLVLRGYHQFDKNWHLAASFTSRLMTKENLPYYLSQALGYRRDYVRGYEYYVIEGNNFWLGKVNLKYALLKPAVRKLKWPPTERFNTIPYALYLGAYFDIGKVWPEETNSKNQLQNDILTGIGLGLDFVTYYDKVVRAEFSVNGRGETGFFLHFMAAI